MNEVAIYLRKHFLFRKGMFYIDCLEKVEEYKSTNLAVIIYRTLLDECVVDRIQSEKENIKDAYFSILFANRPNERDLAKIDENDAVKILDTLFRALELSTADAAGGHIEKAKGMLLLLDNVDFLLIPENQWAPFDDVEEIDCDLEATKWWQDDNWDFLGRTASRYNRISIVASEYHRSGLDWFFVAKLNKCKVSAIQLAGMTPDELMKIFIKETTMSTRHKGFIRSMLEEYNIVSPFHISRVKSRMIGSNRMDEALIFQKIASDMKSVEERKLEKQLNDRRVALKHYEPKDEEALSPMQAMNDLANALRLPRHDQTNVQSKDKTDAELNKTNATSALPPTMCAMLRRMNSTQKLTLILDIFDIVSDFTYFGSIRGHSLGILVLIFAFLGVAMQVIKWLVLRKDFMKNKDDWDQAQDMIYVGYGTLLVEDLPQIILVFLIVEEESWDIWSELSFGVSICSCVWKMSQELLLTMECLVSDETHERQTSLERCCSFVRLMCGHSHEVELQFPDAVPNIAVPKIASDAFSGETNMYDGPILASEMVETTPAILEDDWDSNIIAGGKRVGEPSILKSAPFSVNSGITSGDETIKTSNVSHTRLTAKYIINREEIKLLEQIGGGHYGNVWKGEYDLAPAAIKTFKKELSNVDSLLEEAAILAEMKPHINLCRFLGVVHDAEMTAVVLEYIPHGSVLSFMEKHKLSLGDKYNILHQAAKGIYALHKQNIIHRDIALRNVLMRYQDQAIQVFVTEFGLSLSTSSVNTERDQFPVAWCAPECLEKARYSEKSDVFAFGVMIWELLSEEMPFKGECLKTLMVYIVHHDKRLDIHPKWDPSIQAKLRECWEKYPEDRPSIKDIHDLLERLVAKT